MKRFLVIAAVGVGVVLVVVALALARRPQTAKVEKGPMSGRIVARAAVVAGEGLAHVYTSSDGRVTRVLVREGDTVEAKQTLAELEVSGKRERLESNLRAVVLARRVEVGDWVVSAEHGAREPLFELADPARTELRIEIEEADAARVVKGQAVSIKPTGFGHESAQGRVEHVSARLETRSIGVEDARMRAGGVVRAALVAFSGARPSWPIGTRAEAVIEVSRHDAAARIPRAAISVRDGRSVVERPFGLWANEAPVEVLSVDETFAEIRGLSAGTEVIVPEPQ